MTDDQIFPTAISIAGYRSFGSEISDIGPLRRLNFIVGQNNSGKSNIIRVLTVLSSIFGQEPRYKLRSSDFNQPRSKLFVALYFPTKLLKDKIVARGSSNGEVQAILKSWDDAGDFPFPFSIRADGNLEFDDRDIELFVRAIKLDERQFRDLSLYATGAAGNLRSNAERVLQQFPGREYIANKVLLIPQLRSVHAINQYTGDVDPFLGKGRPYCFTGERLIDILFELQRPHLNDRRSRLF